MDFFRAKGNAEKGGWRGNIKKILFLWEKLKFPLDKGNLCDKIIFEKMN